MSEKMGLLEKLEKAFDDFKKLDGEVRATLETHDFHLLKNKVLAILRQHESSPQTREIQKLIENMKVDVLGMFCYQGPPSKHWIDTKGQFWKGWNEACDKILEKLLAKKGSE